MEVCLLHHFIHIYPSSLVLALRFKIRSCYCEFRLNASYQGHKIRRAVKCHKNLLYIYNLFKYEKVCRMTLTSQEIINSKNNVLLHQMF